VKDILDLHCAVSILMKRFSCALYFIFECKCEAKQHTDMTTNEGPTTLQKTKHTHMKKRTKHYMDTITQDVDSGLICQAKQTMWIVFRWLYIQFVMYGLK
jgi:hypothetical protein